jgi:murein DD-endopeptidase MepM/ murein hydrolase activator NlpD
MNIFDRLLTIVVTATVTSAGWIVARGIDVSGAANSAGARVSDAAARIEERDRQVSINHPRPVTERGKVATDDIVIPVSGVTPDKLSDTFSDARGGGTRLHEALDIMAPAGTPVIAAGAGSVERLFLSQDGGNTIYVRSPDRRTIHYYAHLQGYAAGLHEGQVVRRGELLGVVGSTGNASPEAPHLHFAVLRTTPEATWSEPATAVNPYPLLVR